MQYYNIVFVSFHNISILDKRNPILADEWRDKCFYITALDEQVAPFATGPTAREKNRNI